MRWLVLFLLLVACAANPPAPVAAITDPECVAIADVKVQLQKGGVKMIELDHAQMVAALAIVVAGIGKSVTADDAYLAILGDKKTVVFSLNGCLVGQATYDDDVLQKIMGADA
jgi:intracellular septation protein A